MGNSTLNSSINSSFSVESDSELIKNLREKIANKAKKNLATDLLPFDNDLRYSWLNSYTSGVANKNEKTVPKTEPLPQTASSVPYTDCASSKPATIPADATYLIPVVRFRNQTQTQEDHSGSNRHAVQVEHKSILKKEETPTESSQVDKKEEEEEENLEESANQTSVANNSKFVKNPNSNTNNRKIHKIINTIAEKEYEKINRRIEKRNERIPELLEELAFAQGDERSQLEKELNILMRKYKFDKKKSRELKKPCQMDTELSTVNENEDNLRRKEKTSVERDMKQFLAHNNFSTHESGYSSYEDSVGQSRSQSLESLLKNENDARTKLRSISLSKSPTFQTDFVKKTLQNDPKFTANRWEASKLQEMSHEIVRETAV